MLAVHLNNKPYSKFVLIEDALEDPGGDLLAYIVQQHTFKDNHPIHYFILEGNFEERKSKLVNSKIKCYDFTSDFRGWFNKTSASNFLKTLNDLHLNDSIVVIDSLAHIIHEYGLITVYKHLHKIIYERGLVRIITLLHQDFFEDPDEICRCLEHLSTFTLSLEPKFKSDKSRVTFTYKKASGKIIKQTEEYTFENGLLKSEPLKAIDSKTLIQESLNEPNPETLTTFRIGLDEKEKEARAKLVLPYLPKEGKTEEINEIKVGEGQIFYQFDDVDDWDEEDPDDDLDL